MITLTIYLLPGVVANIRISGARPVVYKVGTPCIGLSMLENIGCSRTKFSDILIYFTHIRSIASIPGFVAAIFVLFPMLRIGHNDFATSVLKIKLCDSSTRSEFMPKKMIGFFLLSPTSSEQNVQ